MKWFKTKKEKEKEKEEKKEIIRIESLIKRIESYKIELNSLYSKKELTLKNNFPTSITHSNFLDIYYIEKRMEEMKSLIDFLNILDYNLYSIEELELYWEGVPGLCHFDIDIEKILKNN